MLTCPMCKKAVPDLTATCPTCRSDLSLLVDYVSNLRDGLAKAESATRAGQLSEAVWAYLNVLDVDPDNAVARRQVGQVVAAVRHFDRASPGRRWLQRIRRHASGRGWAAGDKADGAAGRLGLLWLVLVALGALLVGYLVGYQAGQPAGTQERPGEMAPE